MRTLTVHTADELVERWKRQAIKLLADPADDYFEGMAQGYRVCAAELMGILAVAMELEATHHGNPEPVDWSSYPGRIDGDPEPEDPNGILEWLLGQRP